MALITRVSRLFQADLHAVLDRIEEPEILLRQALREMEDAHALDQQRARLARHERAQLIARGAELSQSLRETDDQLDVCFEQAKEDLARTLVKRKLETERAAKTVERKREALESSLSELEARLGENQSKLEAMRQKIELIAQTNDPGEPESVWAEPESPVRDDEIEVAFLQERGKRKGS